LNGDISVLLGVLRNLQEKIHGENEITFRMLLAHSSGLRRTRGSFCGRQLGKNYCVRRLQFREIHPGTHYWSTATLALSCSVSLSSELAEEPLDRFSPTRKYSGHLECCKPRSIRRRVEVQNSSRRQMTEPFASESFKGEVQDENASVLGGVAGQLSFFDGNDVAIFSQALLGGGTPLWPPETVALFTRRASRPRNVACLGMGYAIHSVAVRQIFLLIIIRHLGYTGTHYG